MSETPRTDEAKIWLDILPTFQMSYEKVLDFSRQLERELAEAKAELAKVQEGFDMCQSDYEALAERWGEALKERDLAQDELAKVQEAFKLQLEMEEFRRLTLNDLAGTDIETMGDVAYYIKNLKAELADYIRRTETAEDSLAFQMDINQKIGSELAKVREENEWHHSSFPPNSKRSVLIHTSTGIIEVAHYVNFLWLDVCCEEFAEHITHWRELPKPPRIEEVKP